ncbi:MAG: hypothetical protein KJO07_09490 [Deltaproteobacteria bacterium]|nr:hypothetical protein [Deltaproteobacteria bacterium]
MTPWLPTAGLALALSWAAPATAGPASAAPGGKAEVVDFSGEVDAVEPVTALPKAQVAYQPMLPARYRKRRNQPAPAMEPLEDPLPLKPQKRGCGACNAGGSPGPAAALLALGALLVIGRRRRGLEDRHGERSKTRRPTRGTLYERVPTRLTNSLWQRPSGVRGPFRRLYRRV